MRAVAADKAVSDRAARVFTIVATLGGGEVTAAQIAHHLPPLEEDQAAQILGRLVSAGWLTKRLRVVGYRDGNRVRRSAYSLTGGAL